MSDTIFQHLFELPPARVKQLCVVVPFLPRSVALEWDLKLLKKSPHLSTWENRSLTVIQTRIGPLWVGDAVLALASTACRNIVFWGSCGVVCPDRGLKVGDIVLPVRSYGWESFTALCLAKALPRASAAPHPQFFKQIKKTLADRCPQIVNCASLGSIVLEKGLLGSLKKEKIDVVDMESASCFAAAKKIKAQAVAVLYCSDMLTEKSAYAPLSLSEKNLIRQAQITSARLVTEIIELKP